LRIARRVLLARPCAPGYDVGCGWARLDANFCAPLLFLIYGLLAGAFVNLLAIPFYGRRIALVYYDPIDRGGRSLYTVERMV
jgi:hypothetical protein